MKDESRDHPVSEWKTRRLNRNAQDPTALVGGSRASLLPSTVLAGQRRD